MDLIYRFNAANFGFYKNNLALKLSAQNWFLVFKVHGSNHAQIYDGVGEND